MTPRQKSGDRPATPRKGAAKAPDAPEAGSTPTPAPTGRQTGAGRGSAGRPTAGTPVPPPDTPPGAGRGQSAPAIRVEYVAPETLVPADYNPRRMAPDARARLRRGIEAFGLVDPIVARRRDRLVIGGHQRLDVAKSLGMTTVPVVFLDDLDDQRAAALNVLLNNPNAQGEWDLGRLTDLLSTLDAEGFDATLTGFSEGDLAKLLAGDGGALGGEIVPPESNYREQYAVTVICDDEASQEETYNKLVALGYNCRVVST